MDMLTFLKDGGEVVCKNEKEANALIAKLMPKSRTVFNISLMRPYKYNYDNAERIVSAKSIE
jgi:hypothetical protein